MVKFKTPGVYIQEISKLPASVAPVATAIPAFVGYTEKALKNRENVSNVPVRITSLLEYDEIFGKPLNEKFGVTLEDNGQNTENPKIGITGDTSPYLMHYCMQMYFANGGGPCYVVSVGVYDDEPDDSSIDPDKLIEGLKAFEFEDEPTILIVPEAVKISDNKDIQNIYDSMLDQCARLKDRFAILDALVEADKNTYTDALNFRNNVGISNLNYGGAYYPSLKTLFRYAYNEGSVVITDERAMEGIDKFNNYTLLEVKDGATFKQGKIKIAVLNKLDDTNKIVINGEEIEFEKKGNKPDTLEEIKEKISKNDKFFVEQPTGEDYILIKLPKSEEDTPILDIVFEGDVNALAITYLEGKKSPGKALYNLIKKELDKKRLTLYPSSAMAGVYAKVDRDRGVWKAPANISLNMVDEPVVLLTDDEQAPFNVDASTGKSINVVRKFNQKGTLVWGARTLAGNDNEWRYIPVRRLFIFIEESIKKATEPVVFEPNDANTWSKTKAMIENFLTGLWRNGAIAGGIPEDAFFVNVGLGQTMSAQDILEGRLIIEVGIAAVRPAEFIILKFMHKLQES